MEEMSLSHKFSQSILRKYDIRGIVGEDLNPIDAYALGRAFVEYLKLQNIEQTIAVIKDSRASGIALKAEVIRGIVDGGGTVFDCGIGSTPTCYFASHHLKTSGFIAITGSHNPINYNGFKFGITGKAFSEEKILEIANLAQNLEIVDGGNVVESSNVKNAYIERILQDIPQMQSLKIGFNALNGSAGAILPKLAENLNAKIFECEMNGELPTVLDPSNPQNIERMKSDLQTHGLDVIFAFDGDADRIMAITEKKVFFGEDILFLSVREVFSKINSGKVIFDVKCSNALKNEISKCGGTPVMYKTGHSLIKQKMLEENAVLAGECSGHIYFKNGYYGFDDGIYTAIRVLSYFANCGKTINEIIDEFPKLLKSPEIKVHCGEKFAVVEKLQKLMNERSLKFNDIDGIRCEINETAWFLVRASNTEEVLIVRYESENEGDFSHVKALTTSLLLQVGIEFTA